MVLSLRLIVSSQSLMGSSHFSIASSIKSEISKLDWLQGLQKVLLGCSTS